MTFDEKMQRARRAMLGAEGALGQIPSMHLAARALALEELSNATAAVSREARRLAHKAWDESRKKYGSTP